MASALKYLPYYIMENNSPALSEGAVVWPADNGHSSAMQKLRPPFYTIPFLGYGLQEKLLALLGTERIQEVALSDQAKSSVAVSAALAGHTSLPS